MDPNIRDGVTLGIALLGAGLGIINLWRALDRDRVKVIVVPRGYITSHSPGGVCIEVINLGYIPITISQIGFSIRNTRECFMHRSLLERLPKTLEPRTAFTAYLTTGAEQDPSFASVRHAFVRTQCGLTFKGNSPALRSFVKSARAASHPAA